MREIERSAASVEEAIESALDELGASEQEVEVEILQEPRGGFLGLGAQEAVVRVRLPERPAAGGLEGEEEAEIAASFLRGLLDAAGIEGEVEAHVVGSSLYVDVMARDGDEAVGLLIGRHGRTLEALQDLVRSAVQRQTGRRSTLMVDVEDYRKRRRSRLAAKAREVARRVGKTGREEALEPMNAYDRKVVHDAAASVRGVESRSEGEEPERRVVIRRRS